MTWTKSFFRTTGLAIVSGSFIFWGWYAFYVKSLDIRVNSVCAAISPYLQIGSSRWAEDLAKGSLSVSHPEISVAVKQAGFGAPETSDLEIWRSIPCAVTGRTDDSFTVLLKKAPGFTDFLFRKLIGFIFFVGFGLIAVSYLFKLIFAHFMRQLNSALNQHFGIAQPIVQDSYLAKNLLNLIGGFPMLQAPKQAIGELSERLHREISVSSELEIALGQRRFFSKYIHDIRSPLSALKIIFQKKNSMFSGDEANLIKMTFVRLDEISQAVLNTEKGAIQQSLSFGEYLKLGDLNALLEVIVERLKISLDGACVLNFKSERFEDLTGLLKLTPVELDRLLSNLVHNGREADAQNIEISAFKSSGGVGILIGDDGKGGLGPDLRPKRTRSEFTYVSGHGLGLEIVNEILKKGGAKVNVESPVGNGTRIHIQFTISEIPVESRGPKA